MSKLSIRDVLFYWCDLVLSSYCSTFSSNDDNDYVNISISFSIASNLMDKLLPILGCYIR